MITQCTDYVGQWDPSALTVNYYLRNAPACLYYKHYACQCNANGDATTGISYILIASLFHVIKK